MTVLARVKSRNGDTMERMRLLGRSVKLKGRGGRGGAGDRARVGVESGKGKQGRGH